MNLRHVEVFYAIMRTNSITEAARLLNVTQPAVSIALKQLESRLKMKLFDRSGGRLQPTPEAKALLPDVAEIFGRISDLERLSQDLAGGSRGVLSIAASGPLCDGFVAKAVATFVARRPGVRVSLRALPSSAVLDRVINREVDVGVAYEPASSAVVRVDEVMRAVIGCIMPATHPLARRRKLRLRDLRPYPVVTYLSQAVLRPHVDRVLSASDASLNIVVETGTSATGVTLALHGAGIALMETALFLARPLEGLVMVPLEPTVEIRALLLRPRNATSSRIVDAFVSHLKETLPRRAEH
ncbi:LysR family transcriptional regulator [Burkholderiaceae bacterium FT117]|uniref:LysR family transcriptional regulator n=1 Tax=Zeimonas sediminis TaxID=2944268 RepID=UPI002342C660|nr:LysR family transcriptional regulator [Zeimonas sediminis]MCM5570468.1 LysR family transcriptional regulator [Zeimonas sediminis]